MNPNVYKIAEQSGRTPEEVYLRMLKGEISIFDGSPLPKLSQAEVLRIRERETALKNDKWGLSPFAQLLANGD